MADKCVRAASVCVCTSLSLSLPNRCLCVHWRGRCARQEAQVWVIDFVSTCRALSAGHWQCRHSHSTCLPTCHGRLLPSQSVNDGAKMRRQVGGRRQNEGRPLIVCRSRASLKTAGRFTEQHGRLGTLTSCWLWSLVTDYWLQSVTGTCVAVLWHS